jgi:hypothetical protein
LRERVVIQERRVRPRRPAAAALAGPIEAGARAAGRAADVDTPSRLGSFHPAAALLAVAYGLALISDLVFLLHRGSLGPL